MDVGRIVEDFAFAERLPVASIRHCLANRDEVVPAFLRLLRDCDDESLEEEALFLIVHILGELGDKRAFQPLIDFLAGDRERVERALGSALTESLPRILIATFDGDAGRLYAVMNGPEVDEYVRDAAFKVWTYFVITGQIDRADAHQYLQECVEALQPRSDNYVWVSWVDAVAHLGFDDMKDVVRRVFEDDRLPYRVMDFSHFEKMLRDASEAEDRDAWLREEGLYPFEDTIGVLSTWHGFSEQYLREKRRAEIAARAASTVENPFKTFGRNDPCPCGSGKKYKKCCLH